MVVMVVMLVISGMLLTHHLISQLRMHALHLDGQYYSLPYTCYVTFLAKACFSTICFFTKFLFVSRYDKINGIITNFINQTGLSMVETDGPYGGETCASTTHDHHASNDDSIYWQTRLQVRHPPMCRIRV